MEPKSENSFLAELSNDLESLRASGSFRQLREITHEEGALARWDGRRFRNFSSNDYMGVGGNEEWRREFYEICPDLGSPELAQSCTSSRLLTGNTPAYTRLEKTLSEMYNGRAALVFNSGYHANIGILPALAQKEDLILSDKLNHASIIDGLRLSEAPFRRYAHNDMEHLRKLLTQLRGTCRRVFLVTESVFSMDGDCAPLAELVALKQEFDAVLVVDEAHAVGVRGPRGAGLAAELGLADQVDVLVGTFGKAFGSTGAYAIVDPIVKEYLVNHTRSLIFTTGLPPVVLNWSNFVLKNFPALDKERHELLAKAARLREIFQSRGLATGGDSQIVPLVVGGDKEACQLAEKYQQAGILVFPIRHPTVPAGTARLRFSLSAALSWEDVEAAGKLL
jgi:8-amino-7-oxononanoate synthase